MRKGGHVDQRPVRYRIWNRSLSDKENNEWFRNHERQLTERSKKEPALSSQRKKLRLMGGGLQLKFIVIPIDGNP